MSKAILQIAEDVKKIKIDDNFIYNFILAFGKPQITITRLKNGDYNFSNDSNEIIWKKELFYRHIEEEDPHLTIDKMQHDNRVEKYKIRFIVVMNDKKILAHDIRTADSLDININRLSDYVDFFMPWAGLEKSKIEDSQPIADIKASEKMARLYDEIVHNNEIKSDKQIHNLNIFFSRLLFCFFAEDTDIFKSSYFTAAVKNLTKEDGSDTHKIIGTIFDVLNQEKNELDLDFLKDFPYVNGNLFAASIKLPEFSLKARQILIECGDLNWAEINPDIFGSMIQVVVNPSQRADFGMHYTSVVNIMKVIKPLFLDELHEKFEKAITEKKLIELWNRISKIKIFDPACGSGNFLIIAYKEIREVENKIIKQLLLGKLSVRFRSKIQLSNFFGIEINDFAHEIAILSLHLAKHQQNLALQEITHDPESIIPLKDRANIECENATRVKWESICSKEDGDEIYILGNPPYLGARLQTKIQKEDMKIVFEGKKGFKNLDYITCWFYKSSQYIKGINAKYAFVSTNSINQGEQVVLIWPHIFNKNLEIYFAYKSFKWKNNAKQNAGVTVVIIGVRNVSSNDKFIYYDNLKKFTKSINAYLVSGSNTIVSKRSKPLSDILPMCFGSMANDDGNLFLTEKEYTDISQNNSGMLKYIRLSLGGQEFLNNQKKYCFWITDTNKEEALKFPNIVERVDRVKKYRLASKRLATQKLANISYRFAEVRHIDSQSILIPATSSERRKYIPVGFLQKETIITNATNAIYNANPFILGVISSHIHMIWIKAVGGSLETRIRYSSSLSYNTFPFPKVTQKQKAEIAECVFNILDRREQHSEKTLAQLYDPDKMPQGLKEAHHQLDLVVEQCYWSKLFKNDEERLEYLFKLYEIMISEEKNKK